MASAAGLFQFRSNERGNGFVMHNVSSLTVSVPSNTSFERTAQSCALGALGIIAVRPLIFRTDSSYYCPTRISNFSLFGLPPFPLRSNL